ncbi:MAG: phenylacetate--CoA ligase family protein [Flavobacteriaceae bacterium]
MGEHFDALETRSRDERDAAFFEALPRLLADTIAANRGWRAHLEGVDPAAVTSREALSRLPLLRKEELAEAQKKDPPFGGFASAARGARVFMSPGPVYEPQPSGSDPWRSARAMFAAGIRAGDVVHNGLAYHLTPGGFILDEGARALGCVVIPGGVGNTEGQVEIAAHMRATAYTGTPDFLKVMLGKAAELGRDLSSISRALVSGGALFPALRAEYRDRGVAVLQAYATADAGVIAYESEAMDGMIVSEDVLVEIVRPGTGEPVPDGDVGELVVTSLNPGYPLVRFATGDLSAIAEGPSPCGRTNARIKGWMGRADQRTKVKGMFVDPKQIAEIAARHPEAARLRLVVSRENDQDQMVLLAESKAGNGMADALAESLQAVVKIRGRVEIVAPDSLPNDGKVIADERKYD